MKFTLFSILLCLFIETAWCQQRLVINDSTELVSNIKNAQYFVDATNKISFQQVLNSPFTLLNKDIINFGNVDESYWFKIDVENRTQQDVFFHLKNWELEIIDFYVVDNAGKVDSSKAGLFRQFSGHFFETSSTTFCLGKQPKSIFFKIKNPNIYLPVFFGTIQPLVKEMHQDNLLNGLLIGVMLAISIYNLVLFFYFKEKLYFFCFAYIFSTVFAICRSQGFLHQFLFQDSVFFNSHSNLGIILSVVFGFFFVTGLLNSKQITPHLHNILRILCLSLVGLVVVHLFVPKAFIQNLIYLFLVVNAFVFLITANFVWYKGYKPAKFFVFGWSIYLIGLILLIMSLSGVWTQYYLSIFIFWRFSFAIEFFFIAFAIAYRFNQIRLEALEVQALAVKRSEENEQLLLAHNQLLQEKMQLEQNINTNPQNKRIDELLQKLEIERDKNKKLGVHTLEGVILLPVQDILRIEALGSYCTIFLSNNKKIVASKPIAYFEQQLAEDDFFRIHKSHLINIQKVERYIRGEGGSVIMVDGSELAVSRNEKVELLQKLSIN